MSLELVWLVCPGKIDIILYASVVWSESRVVVVSNLAARLWVYFYFCPMMGVCISDTAPKDWFTGSPSAFRVFPWALEGHKGTSVILFGISFVLKENWQVESFQ